MTPATKATHSPLPWRVTADLNGNHRMIEDARGLVFAALLTHNSDIEKDIANAEFIAKAANAYGALQSALSFALNSLEEITNSHTGYFITGGIWERAKEAMKCARAALGREADDAANAAALELASVERDLATAVVDIHKLRDALYAVVVWHDAMIGDDSGDIDDMMDKVRDALDATDDWEADDGQE